MYREHLFWHRFFFNENGGEGKKGNILPDVASRDVKMYGIDSCANFEIGTIQLLQ